MICCSSKKTPPPTGQDPKHSDQVAVVELWRSLTMSGPEGMQVQWKQAAKSVVLWRNYCSQAQTNRTQAPTWQGQSPHCEIDLESSRHGQCCSIHRMPHPKTRSVRRERERAIMSTHHRRNFPRQKVGNVVTCVVQLSIDGILRTMKNEERERERVS